MEPIIWAAGIALVVIVAYLVWIIKTVDSASSAAAVDFDQVAEYARKDVELTQALYEEQAVLAVVDEPEEWVNSGRVEIPYNVLMNGELKDLDGFVRGYFDFLCDDLDTEDVYQTAVFFWRSDKPIHRSTVIDPFIF